MTASAGASVVRSAVAEKKPIGFHVSYGSVYVINIRSAHGVNSWEACVYGSIGRCFCCAIGCCENNIRFKGALCA